MKFISTLLVSILLSACKGKIQSDYTEIAQANVDVNIYQEHPGKRLMENNCNICHNPKIAEESLIAPPMVAVKMHYISEGTTKQEFVNAMVDWAKEPSVSKSKMPGAIKKFGLMPYQFYPEQTIVQIADYMFDNEIEKPVWFDDHVKKMHNESPNIKANRGKRKGMGKAKKNNFLEPAANERGMEIVKYTQATLGKNLFEQIQKKGLIQAIEFCNLQAIPITDSSATVHNAKIKRVTDKPRNPNNKASSQELEYIKEFKTQVASGNEVEPILVERGNEIDFFYPIVTNSMCLKCHGTPEKELEFLTLKKIKQLYPTDMAVGYKENEVRGIWKINYEN